jgi:diaminopimelate epimerase
MQLIFYKYHGTGNDFIVIDNRSRIFPLEDNTLIRALCNRNFGIGADGLMLLEEMDGYDFQMLYFNSDGRPGSMCGNGGRCIVHFARQLGIIGGTANFSGTDGPHEAHIDDTGTVQLKMQDVSDIEKDDKAFILNTGSPHYVIYTGDLEQIDTVKKGREIRYSEKYKNHGINVNFVQITDSGIRIRTYERGVENETLACGTGSVAAALSLVAETGFKGNRVKIETMGGDLEVAFRQKGESSFTDIWLIGPAKFVYEGKVETGIFSGR